MKNRLIVAGIASLGVSIGADATGLATCDSGPEEGWVPSEQLKRLLVEQGWQVRRIKVDGGCYEVYAVDGSGQRVEAYFHPESLERVPLDEE